MTVYPLPLIVKNPVPERSKLTWPLKLPFELIALLMAPPATAASPPLAKDVFIARLDVPLAVMTAFTLILRAAFKVSLFALQFTTSFTLISPEPEVFEPFDDRIETLLATSALDNVVPEISPVAVPAVTVPVLVGPIEKSAGSITQSPVVPLGARASTVVLVEILTTVPDVSIRPPLPPRSPACANIAPFIVVTLLGLRSSAMTEIAPPLPLLLLAALALSDPN